MVSQGAVTDFVVSLQEWGVVDIMLPFLLIFTVIFAILQKTKILGAGKKQFNAVIALVVALSVVIPHVTKSYPGGFDVIEILNAFLPQIALIAVVLIMILILVGVFAPAYSGWIALVGAILVAFLFFGTTQYLYGTKWMFEVFGEDVITLIVILVVFGIVIWFITSEKPAGAGAVSKAGDWLKELFK